MDNTETLFQFQFFPINTCNLIQAMYNAESNVAENGNIDENAGVTKQFFSHNSALKTVTIKIRAYTYTFKYTQLCVLKFFLISFCFYSYYVRVEYIWNQLFRGINYATAPAAAERHYPKEYRVFFFLPLFYRMPRTIRGQSILCIQPDYWAKVQREDKSFHQFGEGLRFLPMKNSAQKPVFV